MKLSVIGAGYVGLTTAACLAQIGHDVFCSESDLEKLSKLQNGVMPLFEPHLEDVIKAVRKAGRLRFGSTEEAIAWGDAIFICVGTPPLPNGDADLSCHRRSRPSDCQACLRLSAGHREEHRAGSDRCTAAKAPVGASAQTD